MSSESSNSVEQEMQEVPTAAPIPIHEIMMWRLYGPDRGGILKATHYFCRLLIEGPDHLKDELLNEGILPRLVQLVEMTDQPKLQSRAVWALASIACGTAEHARQLIEAGAIPALIKLLDFPSHVVQREALRALGNITEAGVEGRNLMLNEGLLTPLIHILECGKDLELMRVAIEALCKVCLDKNPLPDFGHLVQQVLPVLARLHFHSDPKVLTDSCWAVHFLCQQPGQGTIQAVIDAGMPPRLIDLLGHDNEHVACGSLKALASLLKGADSQKQTILDSGILLPLEHLLTSANVMKSVRSEACLTLANITHGNPSQIQDVINAGFVPILIELLRTADSVTREHAAFALTNALGDGTMEQTEMLVQCGCIPPLCDLLDSSDKWMLGFVLFGLEAILHFGESRLDDQGFNVTALAVLFSHGLDKLDALREHKDPAISSKAIQLVDLYFARISFEIVLS